MCCCITEKGWATPSCSPAVTSAQTNQPNSLYRTSIEWKLHFDQDEKVVMYGATHVCHQWIQWQDCRICHNCTEEQYVDLWTSLHVSLEYNGSPVWFSCHNFFLNYTGTLLVTVEMGSNQSGPGHSTLCCLSISLLPIYDQILPNFPIYKHLQQRCVHKQNIVHSNTNIRTPILYLFVFMNVCSTSYTSSCTPSKGYCVKLTKE